MKEQGRPRIYRHIKTQNIKQTKKNGEALTPGDVKQLPVTQTDISVESKFIQVNRVAKTPFTRQRVQSDCVIVTGFEQCTVPSADIKRRQKRGCLVLFQNSDFFSLTWPLGSPSFVRKSVGLLRWHGWNFPLEFYCLFEWPRAPDPPLQKHWAVGCLFFQHRRTRRGWLCGLFFVAWCCRVLLWGNTTRSQLWERELRLRLRGRHTLIQNDAGSHLTSHRLVLVSVAWHCASSTKSHHGSTVYIFQRYVLGCGTCKQGCRENIWSIDWVKKYNQKMSSTM